ncbi:MAG TPA: HAD hydrolase family protein [Candidatus Nanoarchaeia archaeon]|nr:HAD hydrolase family protein [Candidatus Nanoarchaeia archaeon]
MAEILNIFIRISTIIIGDGENDIDLFTLQGYKIAVSNAAERLKLFAGEVTLKKLVHCTDLRLLAFLTETAMKNAPKLKFSNLTFPKVSFI